MVGLGGCATKEALGHVCGHSLVRWSHIIICQLSIQSSTAWRLP